MNDEVDKIDEAKLISLKRQKKLFFIPLVGGALIVFCCVINLVRLKRYFALAIILIVYILTSICSVFFPYDFFADWPSRLIFIGIMAVIGLIWAVVMFLYQKRFFKTEITSKNGDNE